MPVCVLAFCMVTAGDDHDGAAKTHLRFDTWNYVGVGRSVGPTPSAVLGVLFDGETIGDVRICDTPLEPCQTR